MRPCRPLSLHLHVPEQSSPSRVRSGESSQTRKRFSSAAHKPRALAGCGPFRRLTYEKGKGQMQRQNTKSTRRPVDDVNNLWHHVECQRALASTVIQIRRNALFTSPEYAERSKSQNILTPFSLLPAITGMASAGAAPISQSDSFCNPRPFPRQKRPQECSWIYCIDQFGEFSCGSNQRSSLLIWYHVSSDISTSGGVCMKRERFKCIRGFLQKLTRVDESPLSSSQSGLQCADHWQAPRRTDPFEPLRSVFDLCAQLHIAGIIEPASQSHAPPQKENHDTQCLPLQNE